MTCQRPVCLAWHRRHCDGQQSATLLHTTKTPTHQKNHQTAQRYTVDPLPFVCLTPFPIKKMLKTALQSAFGRCKHLLRAEIWSEKRLSLTIRRSFRTSEIYSSAFRHSSCRILRRHNGAPLPSIGNTPQIASPYQGQPLPLP